MTDVSSEHEHEHETGRWVCCALCGTRAAELPMTWMTEFDQRRGTVHHCAACVRQNLRAVEAKLPQEWW